MLGVVFDSRLKFDVLNNLINRIFIYSATKIKANIDLLYSTLKPNSSSDFPSAKSNGVRCVSAKIVFDSRLKFDEHRDVKKLKI